MSFLGPLRASGPTTLFVDFEEPIRSELFSVERLETHAASLAAAQRIVPGTSTGRLLAPRLDANARVLTDAYRAIIGATRARRPITPAAEWLLDNYHVVDEQIREIRDDLPPGFYRLLPKLAEGPLAGYPRVFGIAWALVAHSDSALDLARLTAFVAGYQRAEPLTIGELWAIAITLRITLVENLRRLAATIVVNLEARRQADALADEALAAEKAGGQAMAAVLTKLAYAPWSCAFAVQLAQRLRGRDPEATPALKWLSDRLAEAGTTIDRIVRDEVQQQTATNVTVRNVITSMRLVSTINWSEWFESVSLVDAKLRADGEFALMDFATRDFYRRAIETLARSSSHDELDVTDRAIKAAARAREAAGQGQEGPDCDPGYYLVGAGRPRFERELRCRVPLRRRLFRANADRGILGYGGIVALVVAPIVSLALAGPVEAGASAWHVLLLGILAIFLASDMAVALVNRLITQNVGPQLLPGLELLEGIPAEMRTMVAVPVLLTSESSLAAQVERLEVHYLANADDNLHFALLSDWTDSDEEVSPADQQLVAAAAAAIDALNQRHGAAAAGDRFFLLHRRRIWNAGEGKWMGWERKRGKLRELNRLLRGATDTSFMEIRGRTVTLPRDIRFVITLDADTRMPIDAAKRLVGKMGHPLTRPRFDAALGYVVQGHGILQPRVTPSLPMGRGGSLFQRAFSGPNGLDPYAFAVSDVYQDLFDQGSFVGKGIYDVDIFEQAMEGRIPEGTVLSHDLLEGIFARAGLASDVEVVEEYPSRYDVAAARQHRWTRGDWQLLPWILGLGTGCNAGPHGAISGIGRWKLLDNLRRSLSAPAAMLAFILGWLMPFDAALDWTAFVLATIAFPSLLPAVAGLVSKHGGVSWRNHLRTFRGDLALGLLQSAFLIVFLAHHALLMLDAVMRSLVRLLVTRRRLLEWTTAAQSAESTRFDARGILVPLVASVAFTGGLLLLVVFVGPDTWPIAAPVAALWMFSPVIALLASAPPARAGHLSIKAADRKALRLIGRRTWYFFETFVTAADNMLPPDNYQEDPEPAVAHRTSPTNVGLYLLSVVAARDFGWQGTLDAASRLEATLATMRKLKRFRGHFYNWYGTQDLRALEPEYVSSVDSGNLAGHLIALGNACRGMASQPALGSSWLDGVGDSLDLLLEAVRLRPALPPVLAAELETFAGLIASEPDSIFALPALLDRMAASAGIVAKLTSGSGDEALEVAFWTSALRDSVETHRRDLETLLPWIRSCARDPALVGPAGRLSSLGAMPTLGGLPALCREAVRKLVDADGSGGDAGDPAALIRSFEASEAAARQLLHRAHNLAEESASLAMEMEFGFLFDPDRQLLSIGYRDADGSLDPNHYDLLASEARLASFVAIAKGDVPARHWFRLGRTLTPIDGGSGLISWSGSMFEYLMPSLVMRAPAGSLLAQTNRLIVRRQIEYGAEIGTPWGMSESQYNARDLEHNYQYSSFGVPNLGYKRALGENIVIAPYATALAAMIDPAAAVRNFERLTSLGARGRFGWYEALDYTRSRVPDGAPFAIARAYMAHHQAMTIVAIANALGNGAMRARFHSEPIVEAAELLLQERMPRDVAVARPPPVYSTEATESDALVPEVKRRYTSVHSRMPRTQLLSNGRYSVMVTAVGSGFTRWRDVAVTRWREDPTRDCWGSYIYLRDVRGGEIWSAGYQPTGVEPDAYRVQFEEDRAEFVRHDGALQTMVEIAVSPEDDAEVRRVSITNHGDQAREIELTSYAELSLARQPDDLAHPAFAKLFVETEFVEDLGAILATRRRRSDGDPRVWAAHLVVVEGDASHDVQFETDRARFLGRGQTARTPAAVLNGWPLSNTAGPVLDPVFSLRRRVTIPRGGTVRLAFWTMAAPTREAILDLADRHRDPMAYERATTLAWTQAQIQLRHLGITADDAHLFQRLANHILYSDRALRPPSEVLKAGAGSASTLWAHGISGDRPILLVQVAEDDDLGLVRQLLRAHEYWRLKQLAVDLVILNERGASYVQDLQNGIETLVRLNHAMPRIEVDVPEGSVFVLRADLVPGKARSLLASVARAVLNGGHGSLAEQVNRSRDFGPQPSPPSWPVAAPAAVPVPLPRPGLEYFNGFGGFAAQGREYVILHEGPERTPAPWINVVANPCFGFQASAEGGGYAWALNSQQNQLTPWSNDPVGDAPGDLLYVRDEDSGRLWSATALPVRAPDGAYRTAHGQGYSRFEHEGPDLALELLQFVPVDDPVKISRLTIVNRSGRARNLSVTAFVEWVLGASRTATAPFVVTEIDSRTGAMFARNTWNDTFGGRVAFADLAGRQVAWTGDRTEFIGRDGTLARPFGLAPGASLSGRVGAGLDPCGALQARVTLAAGGSANLDFFLGEAGSAAEAASLVAKYRAADLETVFTEVTAQWDRVCGKVQVRTPERALDILLNRWLPYQILACRLWARAGFYQASGAYGFRDQLQDVMALCLSRPDLAREHILRAAGRQFVEGDVQHWWLAESGRGIRTRVADDRVWLAYSAAHYVEVTGDRSILDESVPFLEGPVLGKDERDAFYAPGPGSTKASLFDHCALALDKSLATGSHGLPLMGTGDWNDGMDRVGEGGRGESVWLGWFLYAALDGFSRLADDREPVRAEAWRAHMAALKSALETHAWDGDWYRRAFFDDGTPLGSVTNSECRIDSIAQSWAAISGAAELGRAARAMAAVDKYLIRRDDRVALLFTPPFNRAVPDPGYIKGYPAGVRENGGQYTHAATWAASAFAALGDGDKAFETLSMLNPINHASNRSSVHRYKVEPYVISADIYSEPPHVGRGGWTWYTGSAGWFYRVALERILGLCLQGDKLLIAPCIPKGWPGYEMTLRHGSSIYHLAVENPLNVCGGVLAITLDGEKLPHGATLVPLVDDGAEHRVQVILG